MKNLSILFLILFAPFFCYAKGGGSSVSCTASAPSQATAVGYTNLVGCSTLQTLQDIDLKNTKQSGFNWYLESNLPSLGQTTAIPAPVYNDGTGMFVNVNNSNNNPLGTMISAISPDGTHLVGNTWSGGGYWEIDMKWVCTLGCTNAWPVPWLLSAGDLLTPQQTHTSEIDIFEFDQGAAPITNLYDLNPNGSTGYSNTNNMPSMGTPDYTQYHTYGVLWVTAANNGGTGYVKFYFDNVLKTTVTYSATGAPTPSTCRNPFAGPVTCPNGTFSFLDSDTLFYKLSTDNPASFTNHATYRNFHVWQASR